MVNTKDYNLVWFDPKGHGGDNKQYVDAFDSNSYNLYTFVN